MSIIDARLPEFCVYRYGSAPEYPGASNPFGFIPILYI